MLCSTIDTFGVRGTPDLAAAPESGGTSPHRALTAAGWVAWQFGYCILSGG